MADKAMDTYLNDHLAGAMFGSDLAEQIASQIEDAEHASCFRVLAGHIEADRQTLSALMDRLDTTKNPVKQAATWLAEKLSRVKLTGASSGESELGLFMAIETLSLGVEGKASLWRLLKDVSDRYPALNDTELDGLIVRAESQRELLEGERATAGRHAFGTSPPS